MPDCHADRQPGFVNRYRHSHDSGQCPEFSNGEVLAYEFIVEVVYGTGGHLAAAIEDRSGSEL